MRSVKRNVMQLMLTAVLILAALGLGALASGKEAYAATTLYSGTNGTCAWTIDSNGLMTISPADGASTGTLEGYSDSSKVPWYSYRKSVTKVVVEDGVSLGTDGGEFLFNGFSNMTSADLSALDTSGATQFGMMFNGCSSVTSLDLSDWDTSSVVIMSYMFRSCESLEELDLSGWDTSSLKQTNYMFASCYALKSLDLSSFSTGKVTTMEKMFVNCYALEDLDVSSFNTANVESFYMMFSGCGALTYLDMSKFYMYSMPSANYMTDMFADCDALRTVKLSNSFGYDGECPLVEPNSEDYGTGRWRNIGTGLDYDDASVIPTNASGIYVAVFETEYASGKYVPIGGELSVGTLTLSSSSYTYSGSARKPSATVTFAGVTLTSGTDYKVTYSSGRKNVGTYTVTVTGKGSYTGTLSATFKIKAQTLKSDNASLSTTSYTYNGTARKPSVTLTNTAGTKLTKNTDYTVSYASGRKNAGTYKVTITGKGNYTGTVTKTFTIKQKSISSDSASAKVTLSKTSYTYSGKAKKPSVTLKITLNGTSKKLTKDTDYTVSYSDNENAGTATVTIKGTGNYKGTVKKTFTIKKKTQSLTVKKASTKTVKYSKVKSAKQTVKVISKVSGAKGTVTYSKVSDGSSKYLSVDKSTGKVTVKKGTPKGTYKIKIKVTSAATTNYKKASETVTVTVKVK